MRAMIKFKYWSLLAVSALLAACSSDDFRGTDSEGGIRLSLTVDTQPLGSKSSRAELNELTTDDMKVRLISKKDSKTSSWESVAEFEKEEKFAIGDYTLEVYYGQPGDCGFEKPYVYGSADITVHHGETTQVALEAALANSMVSVTYSDAVQKFFSDYSVSLAADKGSVVYATTEARPAYVNPGNIDMRLAYTDDQAQKHDVHVTNFTAEARHHYHVNIDINGGEYSDAVMTITFDDSMTSEEIEVKLENLTTPGAPVTSAEGYTDGEPLQVVAGSSRADDLYCSIIARGGIKSLKLATEGNNLIAANWPAEIDLAAATANQQSTLKGKGLNVLGLWGNKSDDKEDAIVVDFRDIVKNLADDTQGDITFTLTPVDTYGQEAEAPITLTLSVTPLKIAITDAPTEVWEGEDAFTMTLEYNGGDPNTNLQVVRTNDRGTVDNVTATFTNSGENKYTVSFDVTSTELWGEDFTILVQDKSKNTRQSNKATFSFLKKISVHVDEANVWAKKAYVTLQNDVTNEYLTPDELTYTYTLDGTSHEGKMTKSGNNMMLLDGLTPEKEYEITVVNTYKADQSPKADKFTTEAATQLPNGNLDADVTNDGSKSHWENVGFLGWGTNNPMTTSQGSNYAYCRISGTKQVSGSDAHSGKAARIATQGWGSGNTATGSDATSGTCKYIDAGLLHLGSSRTTRPEGYKETSGSLNTDDLVCGIDFSSRPSSVSFWFKYEPKSNSDSGEALAEVYDASGNKIASSKMDLKSTSAYTQATVNLSYADNAGKAAKIYIRFLSTNQPTAVTRTNGWLSGPGFGNLSRGEFAGAALYIDEVTLNY